MQRSTGMEQLRQRNQQAMILQQARKKQLQLQYQCHPQMQFPPTTYQSHNTILQLPIYPNHPSQNYVYHQQQQMGSKPMTTQSVQRQGNKRKRQDIGQVAMTKVVTSIPPANGKTSANLNSQSNPSPSKASGSLLVDSGLPTDTLGEGLEWPKGWIKIKKQRLGGASAGTFDCYWISPILKHRLRSLPEVRKFLRALQANGGDELLAKQILRRKKPKQEKTEPSKNKKPALKKATKKGGKSPKPKVQRRPKPSLQTPPSSAKNPSSVAQNSQHSVVTKKVTFSNQKTNAATKSRAKGVPISATQTSQNVQTDMKVEPMPTSQAAVAVATKTSERMALAEKSSDAMATSTAPKEKQPKDLQQQNNGHLSQQQQQQKQKQNQVPSPDAQDASPECPLSGQKLVSSIVSGDSDDFGGKIGFAEYHIEL